MLVAAPGSATRIFGTLTGPEGTSAGGVEISLFRQDSTGTFSTWAWQNSRPDGGFDFDAVPAGTYRLGFVDRLGRFAFEYYQDSVTLEDAVDLEFDGLSPLRVDAALEAGGTLEGTLLDPVGTPLDATLVALFSLDGRLVDIANANSGTWSIDGLATGSYRARFTGQQPSADGPPNYYQGWWQDRTTELSADPIAVTAGSVTSGIDAVLGFAEGGSLAGQIVDPYGRPFRSARVEAWESDGDGGWRFVRGFDTTDYYYDGEWDLDLPPGTYRLRLQASSWWDLVLPVEEWFDDVIDVESALDLDLVLGSRLRGIDAVLGNYATGALEGVVRDHLGLPRDGIEVYLWTSTGRELAVHRSITAPDGSWRIDGIWPGEYTVEFFDPSYEYPRIFLGGAASAPTADPILVEYEMVNGIEQELLPGTTELGSVSGRITSEDDGTPLAGIAVTGIGSGDDEQVARTRSGEDGRYRIRGVEPDQLRIRFESVDGTSVSEWYDDAPSEADADPVPVLVGADTGGIDAELANAGAIRGEVVNGFGRPFSLTTVHAWLRAGDDWTMAGSTSLIGESRYELSGLPPGTYRVAFSGGSWTGPRLVEWWDDQPDLASANDLVLQAGVPIEGVDAVLGSSQLGSVSGAVRDASGDPVPGIEVVLWDEWLAATDRTTVTDAAGLWAIELLPSELYYVQFIDPSGTLPGEFFEDASGIGTATPLLVGGGAAITGVDAVLDGAGGSGGGASISGRVTVDADGTPLAGIVVSCSPIDSGAPWLPCTTTTEADGTYRVGGNLPAGAYRVRFTATDGAWVGEYWDDVRQFTEATPIALESGEQRTGIDAGLAFAGGLSGRVVDGFGRPLSTLVVEALIEVDGVWVNARTATWRNQADWQLLGLPPATYRLRFADGVAGFSSEEEFYDDQSSVDTALDLEVRAGELLDGLDAVLRDDLPGGLEGSVLDANGQAVGAIDVRVLDPTLEIVSTVQTGPDGSWSLAGLLPGRYYVEFSDPSGALPGEAWQDVPSAANGTPIEVGFAVVPGIDARLDGATAQQGGAAIEGTVSAADSGNALAGIEVRCFTPSGFPVEGCVTTSAVDGTYRLGGNLPAGSYAVLARDRSSGSLQYEAQWYELAVRFGDATFFGVELGESRPGIDFVLGTAPGVPNGGFDQNLDGWLLPSGVRTTTSHASEDLYDAIDSGSLRVAQETGGAAVASVCLDLLPGEWSVSAAARAESEEPVEVGLGSTAFAASGCAGSHAGIATTESLLSGHDGAWRDLGVAIDADAGSVRIELTSAGPTASTVWWDAVRISSSPAAPSGLVFRNGFESGDSSAWSAVP